MNWGRSGCLMDAASTRLPPLMRSPPTPPLLPPSFPLSPPQQINAHQADFLRMVMEPGEEGEDDEMGEALAAMAGGEGGLPPGVIAVELSEEDQAAIGRLEALGFDRSACIEAYLRWGGDGLEVEYRETWSRGRTARAWSWLSLADLAALSHAPFALQL
jgi:hypothetical protein